MTAPYKPPVLPAFVLQASTPSLAEKLEQYWDLQEADEHPPVIARKIRDAIDSLERELRLRRSR